jgi:uncharacterized protein YukE
MANIYGADVQQLRALAEHFESNAEILRSARVKLDSSLRHVTWLGPASQRFREQWEALNAPRIARAAAMLVDTAAALRRNASEQEQASRANGD